MSGHVSPDVRATAEAIARLPRTFLSRGDISAFAILEQSGYLERHADVTPDLLAEILTSDASLVDDWLAYSENKRTSSGWYFLRGIPDFAIGYVSDAGHKIDEDTYSDGAEACSNFIKKELEEMRQVR